MLGREKAFDILEKALKWSGSNGSSDTQLVLGGYDHFLSRYANSQIHQNTAIRDNVLYVRVARGKKLGVATVNSLKEEDVKHAIDMAKNAAQNQREVTDFKGFPHKASGYENTENFFSRTETINPEEKALVIKDMIERISGDRVSLSGAFYTGTSEVAVANSNGVRGYTNGTLANIAVTASAKETSGYASASDRDVDKLDHTLLIEEALESAKPCNRSIELEPGEYQVILEEYAVADLLMYLSWMAFTSEAAEDGSSFLIPHKGEKMFDDHISIYDDGLNPDTFTMPFDYEGTPKTRVDFIKKGTVTGNLTYNDYGAAREGKKSTGHGVPPGAGLSDSEPFHIFMEAGDVPCEQMVENMEKGILIKRFHYLTSVHPLKTIVSGMTRDGVFMVEKGKITGRVKNMRFTQSIIEALKNTVVISKNRKKIWFREFTLNFPITLVVPRLHIKKFNFTGKTDF